MWQFWHKTPMPPPESGVRIAIAFCFAIYIYIPRKESNRLFVCSCVGSRVSRDTQTSLATANSFRSFGETPGHSWQSWDMPGTPLHRKYPGVIQTDSLAIATWLHSIWKRNRLFQVKLTGFSPKPYTLQLQTTFKTLDILPELLSGQHIVLPQAPLVSPLCSLSFHNKVYYLPT